MSEFHSDYRGWSIWRKNIYGMWSATKAGHLPLAADTLTGLRGLIFHQSVLGGRR